MKNKQSITFLLTLAFSLNLGILPSIAKIDGGISKSHFFDNEKTLMTEITPNKTLKTAKYWEKNLLYFNKYKPLFMLSNKDLYNLMPEENVSVIQRIATPTVYNISLKTASIKTVSLAPQKTIKPAKATMLTKPTPTAKPYAASSSVYEQAKNPGVEPEEKVNAAITLKNSKNPANYTLALDLLNDVTEKEPYNAYAFYLKGEMYAAKKDFENAMKNYVEALKINPSSKQCCTGIAKILEPTNKELAQKYYARAK